MSELNNWSSMKNELHAIEVKSHAQNNKSNGEDEDEEECCVFTEKRHMEIIKGLDANSSTIWTPKDRMRTASVAVVLCLNVGIDPPDVIKPSSCATLQAWTDPFTVGQNAQKSVEVIADNLVQQYARWHPKARFKTCNDPTVEDLKKTCCTLRKSSRKGDRVLFHYNGHGVPKPTSNGEIWVFNRNFTQYIPLSILDLQQWMGTPSIYVFDCSNAGVIVESFKRYAEEQQKEYNINSQQINNEGDDTKMSPPNFENCLLLAACDKDEVLSLHPDLPADLFTSCLTTPLKTFLVWFVKQNPNKLSFDVGMDIVEKIPGSIGDRKSVLGELNWIFTAITDTIAWNSLPHELFQRLFRHDLLVASLFRNFLLAQRIMKSYDCTPISNPPMKPMYHHPMWHSLDMAVDQCLSQLARMHNPHPDNGLQVNLPYVNSQFFTEQLTAFQLWLKLNPKSNSTPEQLPIILQVLLSQVLRSRALDLLGQFLNLGRWAVDLALSVGIYPYMLKLLQSSARELKPFLVFIWTKILAGHYTVYQSDIINEYRYFLNILSDTKTSLKHQVMSVFAIALMVRHNFEGQNLVVQSGSVNPAGSIIDIASLALEENQNVRPEFCKWLLICLGNVWENNEKVRWRATRQATHEKLYLFLDDPVPEVRAAAVFALGTFINSATDRNDHANEIDRNIATMIVQKLHYDQCPLVRKEVLVALQWFVLIFENVFVANLRKMILEHERILEHARISVVDRMTTSTSSSSIPMSKTFDEGLNESINRQHHSDDPAPSRQRKYSAFLNNNISNLYKIFVNPSTPPQPQPAPTISSTPPESGSPRKLNPSPIKYYSLSSMNLASHSIRNIYTRVWHLLELHMLDPLPEVSSMAIQIIKRISDKGVPGRKKTLSDLSSEEWPQESGARGPKTKSGLDSGMHYSGRASVSAVTSPYLPSVFPPKRNMFSRDPVDTSIMEESTGSIKFALSSNSPKSDQADSIGVCRRPLVKTAFVDWCIKQFSEPCSNGSLCLCPNGEHGAQDEEASNWRPALFSHYKAKARSKLAKDGVSRVTQESLSTNKAKLVRIINNARCQNLVFHPYDKFLVCHDYNAFLACNYTQSTIRLWSNKNVEGGPSVTDIMLVNTQHTPQLMAASNDGSVKVWKNVLPLTFSSQSPDDYKFEFKPQLSTAFFIFEDMVDRVATTAEHRSQQKLLFTWLSQNRTLAAGGDTRVIRLWDAQQERKVLDIVTESERITSLTTDNVHLVCAGTEEGSVKLFDCRLGRQPICQTFPSTCGPIVNAQVWPNDQDPIHLVAGTQVGDVCWYDRRNVGRHVRMQSLGGPLSSMCFHENTDVFACAFGEDKNIIQLFTVDTMRGPTIRVGKRKIKHLVFHPFKSKLAFTSTDSSVTIFKTSLRQPQTLTI